MSGAWRSQTWGSGSREDLACRLLGCKAHGWKCETGSEGTVLQVLRVIEDSCRTKLLRFGASPAASKGKNPFRLIIAGVGE